jgi:phosphoribosylformylglycinamidine cyclo-ligase
MRNRKGGKGRGRSTSAAYGIGSQCSRSPGAAGYNREVTRKAYRDAGVDLEAAGSALDGIREAVASTYDSRVLAGLGSFGGLFALKDLPAEPVLVASTDGVGTKTMVATQLGRVSGLGMDIVNHCVNDILVQGARPLFFLDYIASSRLDPAVIAQVVASAAAACREAGIALLGGETAEMPGVYQPGELDLVGTIVGVVDRSSIIDGSAISDGDVVLALASGGLQTNGFSLVRNVLDGTYLGALDPADPGAGSIADALLVPHRSYLKAVTPLLDAGLLHGMAHITGGGIPGNLARVLPDGLMATVRLGSWAVPPVFRLIQERGQVSDEEMHEVFNMGAGFMLVLPEENVEEAERLAGEPLARVGRVERGSGVSLVRQAG